MHQGDLRDFESFKVPSAETQPQLQPALLSLSAMISQYFNGGGV
jgi:hypothetical protein